MSEVVLEPEDVATLMEQVRSQNYPDHDAPELHEAQELTEHVGKTGYLQLGFSTAASCTSSRPQPSGTTPSRT